MDTPPPPPQKLNGVAAVEIPAEILPPPINQSLFTDTLCKGLRLAFLDVLPNHVMQPPRQLIALVAAQHHRHLLPRTQEAAGQWEFHSVNSTGLAKRSLH